MAYLVVRSAAGTELRRKELLASMIIGRATECDLAIGDPRLSRLHCRVEQEGDQWVLSDLNSRNGTYVAGDKIDQRILADGDNFQIGNLRITFHSGKLVPRRPKDPLTNMPAPPAEQVMNMPAEKEKEETHVGIDAAALQAGKEGSTIAGAPPLAFQRPPAVPKVAKPATIDVSPPSRSGIGWVVAAVVIGLLAMTGLYWYIFTH